MTERVEKLLAIKNRKLGDTVLWTCALSALRQNFPNAQIDVAFPDEYSPLFANDPRFRKKWGLKRGLERLREIRREKYDLALNFHASNQSARLTRLSGARKKILHHHSRTPRRFHSDIEVPGLGVPSTAMERDLNVVRSLGWNASAPETKIFVSEEMEAAGRKRLLESGYRERPLLLVGLRASRPAKEWPWEHYLSLFERLSPKVDIGLLVPTSEIFSEHVKRYRPEFAKYSFEVSTPQLSDLMEVLPCGNLYLGCDSGVKHLAAAVGLKTVTLFGPESVKEWHGYDLSSHIPLSREVACRFHDPNPPDYAWCGEFRCPLASHACLSLITVDEVLASVEKLIYNS